MVPSSMTIRNTGHTAEVTLQQTLMPTLMGGDLLAPYTFAQFHFHWGSPSTLGSEHTIDGKRYAAELHVVHYKTAYGNVSAASSYSDGLTVLAMLIQIGEDDNLRLQSVIDGLATIHEAGTTNHIVPFPLRELLPENVENFYSYLGSLTIPPCSEAVIWTIFKEPITMSMNQMSQFFKLLTEENTPLVDTFRPLQPLGNRTVYDGSMTPLWGYEGLIGPQYWPKYFPLCGGSAQSPVNIVTKTVQPVSQLPFVFTNFDATPLTATLENNGHAADVSITMAPGVAIPSLSGGGLTDQYTFAQLHFHWGRNQDEGSEHTINGGRYPGELHIVTYKTQYSTLTQALNYNDGVVVLGIFLKAAPEDNNVLSPIIAGLPRVLNADTTTTIPSFPLQNLLPGNIINYYRYQGSLTTPTCNQVVSWTVFAQPIPISLAQLAAFRTLHDETGQLIEFNFRPVQPLNGRTVFMTKG
ncbi:carbonic anhydrase 2 [Cherax quadricarinatus]